MKPLKQELIDQVAHAAAGVVVCSLVNPTGTFATAALIVALWAVREHGQHKFNFGWGSVRDFGGWFVGGLIYVATALA